MRLKSNDMVVPFLLVLSSLERLLLPSALVTIGSVKIHSIWFSFYVKMWRTLLILVARKPQDSHE